MTLEELIAQFRVDSNDLQPTYLSSNANVTAWLNEAEQEAAIRATLIHESTLAEVCSIAVTAGNSVYALHPCVLDITRAVFTPTGSTTEYILYVSDRVELDRTQSDWRNRVDTPRVLIQDDTKLQLWPIPSTGGLLHIECYRLPLQNMEDSATESPEIARIHHRHLVQWALHRCYERPDAEINDPGRSAKAEKEFTRVFGLRPDANYRRSSQANMPASNKAIW